MKRFLLLMLCCIFSLSVSAQERQTFMGIPIDGSLTSFIDKLQAKGFTVSFADDDIAGLEGPFSGSTRTVWVYATPQTSKVYCVIVQLRTSKSWSSLKSTYSEFKQMLTNKYGEPYGSETFTRPYYEGDGYEMTALRNDKCSFVQLFETPTGTVMLYISDSSDGSVMLSYRDKINSDIYDAEQSSMKYNDL